MVNISLFHCGIVALSDGSPPPLNADSWWHAQRLQTIHNAWRETHTYHWQCMDLCRSNLFQWTSQMVWILTKCLDYQYCVTDGLNSWIIGVYPEIFPTQGCLCFCILLWCFTCLHTYSDRQLVLAGAQQSVDGAVEQLVVVEADVTGIGANHHRVFLRHQLQIARPFLRQQRNKNSRQPVSGGKRPERGPG